MMRTKLQILAILMLLISVGVNAGDAVPQEIIAREIVEFSADMIQQIPSKDSAPGRLYVSKGKIRMETGAGENHKITVVNFTDKKTLHINPTRKAYVEIPWPAGKSDPSRLNTRQPLPGDPHHPCANHTQLKCNMLDKEDQIGERKTEKWEIVRQIQRKDQDPQIVRSLVWVDRKLGANIREERFINEDLKGSSELRAIEEGPQPETLFQAPADYQQLEVPKQASGEPAGGGM